jgi:hypothetical protein
MIQAAALITIIGAVAAQLPGHSVGDEVCVVGYVMDDYCIALGACEAGFVFLVFVNCSHSTDATCASYFICLFDLF